MDIKGINYGLLTLFFYDFFQANKLFLTNNLFIPFPFCGIIGFYFLAINYNRIKFFYIAPILGIYLVSIITIFLAPSLDEFIVKRLVAVFQLIYSTLASFGYYCLLSNSKKKSIEIFFYKSLMFVFILIFIEIIFLKFDIFSQGPIIEDYRNNNFFDVRRVKLGGKEASYVALLFSLLSSGWYSMSNDKNKFYKIIIFSCIGFLLIYSPIVFIPVLIAIIFDYTFKVYSTNPLHNAIKKLFKLSLATNFLIILLLIFIGSRINNIFSLSETSAIIRIIAPPILMLDTISQYPFWGIGLSSLELIKDNIINIYRDIFNYNIVNFDRGITNTLFLIIIYYGILGTILLYYCLKKIEKILGGNNWLFVLSSVLIFSQVMGSVVTPQIWIVFFTFVAMSKKRSELLNIEKQIT